MYASVPTHYIGRFAPSSTGPLHLGSIVAALASWLDARAHQGLWLLRIDDIDTQRCRAEFVTQIHHQLAAFGLHADGEVILQSNNLFRHQQALAQLRAQGHVFACGCSRASIATLCPRTSSSGELIYPGTCLDGLHGKPLRSWRMRVGDAHIHWQDRLLGPQTQDLQHDCGDFVLADVQGHPTYHLACVVDDAAQGITHIVRGADLAPLTARQIFLQRALGLPTPQYLHVPVLTDAQGSKLSKQNGARAVDIHNPLPELRAAAWHLGLTLHGASNVNSLLQQALYAWQARWKISFK
jgi:glutamyl-Q tRNA(Asp) synthetase